ncbi:hypothetical protein QA645_41205 [Bradyrhizobium sp. CIAT3101]|uniref:hypothetical protein n=1 Tax=Bradyrhizobium sp. CIAT3101 TaxID=439387 RepID=UPI0024B22249|nr:hypothetical protein [Bradyrhizobium sp. CIAT3101]WFU80765.1 hypothetical protein QA645_41205 [Bradyrhizobium sp. CIAT3101]
MAISGIRRKTWRLNSKPIQRKPTCSRAFSGSYRSLTINSVLYAFTKDRRPATAIPFNLISTLQFSGTVPMIDIQAYALWLS